MRKAPSTHPAKPLTPQERSLVDSVAKGEVWSPVSNGNADSNNDEDPECSEVSHGDRSVRADVIRYLALGEVWPGETTPWKVHAIGIQVRGARITGQLNFIGATLRHVLALMHSEIEEPVLLQGAHAKHLSFSGSKLNGFDAGGATIDGLLKFTEGFTSKGEVRLIHTEIKGVFDCNNGHFDNPQGTAIDANGAIVANGVFLSNGFSAKGEVNFVSAKISRHLICNNGHFENANGLALNANGITVDGAVFWVPALPQREELI